MRTARWLSSCYGYATQRLTLGAHASGGFVTLDEDERRRHLYIIGQTGTGKSTLLLNLLRQKMA